MTKLLIAMNATPAVLRESLRSALRPHGIELPEHVLHECGNNLTQALFAIDENSFASSDSTEPVAGDASAVSPACVERATAPASSSPLDHLDDRDSDAPRIR